jgi:hypothetical protein
MAAANKKVYWVLGILSTAGYAWIGFHLLFPDSASSNLTVCLVKNVTGVPCPSCGTTRALLLLIAGDFQKALLTNPLCVVAGIGLLITPVWIAKDLVARTNTLALVFLWTEKKIKTKKAVYIPLVALALLNWGWNILKDL